MGFLVSSLSRNDRKAMFAAVFVVLSFTFGPLALSYGLALSFPRLFSGSTAVWPILALSPAYAPSYLLASVSHALSPAQFVAVSGGLFTLLSSFSVPRVSFWWSVLQVHLLSWAMLLLAGRILPRLCQARGSDPALDRQRERVEQWAYGRAEARKTHRARLLGINPFLWLASRERWKPLYVWFYLAAISGTWLWGWLYYRQFMFDKDVALATVLLFQGFLKLWVVSEAAARLAEDRRVGALELLLSTPLTTREILRGQWLAFRRQFAKPLGVILLFEFLLLRQPFATQLVLINLLMLVADVLTLGWVGMWLGLTARSLNRAILGTIDCVLLLPWGAYYTAMFALDIFWRLSGRGLFQPGDRFGLYWWFGIGLVTDFLFGIWWARRHLLNHFREAAAHRYPSERIGWFNRPGRREDVAPLRAPVAAS